MTGDLTFAEHALGRPFHAALVSTPAAAGPSLPHGHHEFFEFMAVLDGRGRHLLPDRSQPMEAGDVLLARPRDRHAMQGLAPAGMRFVNIAFPATQWRTFLHLADSGSPTDAGSDTNPGTNPGAGLGAELTGRQSPSRRTGARSTSSLAHAWENAPAPPRWELSASPEWVDRAREIFELALARFHRDPTMLDILRFWTDLVDLLRQVEADARHTRTTAGPNGIPAPDWLVRLCSEMRREENLRAGVPRMVRLAAVSPAHLSRTMRTHYDTTPTEFVSDLRLELATQLLGTTAEPVTRIAQQCGFSSQSYFTRRFRLTYATSPTEFRRRALAAFVPTSRT